jgi:hypothetical protein
MHLTLVGVVHRDLRACHRTAAGVGNGSAHLRDRCILRIQTGTERIKTTVKETAARRCGRLMSFRNMETPS